MKLVDLKVEEFLAEVNSASPAPGGGSVSALSSSLGVGLLRMVGHLTIPKKKFLKLDEEIQEEFEGIFESLEYYLEQLKGLIDKDTEAFNQIMAAFRLPKETEEDKKYRSGKIEEATVVAIEVPGEVARTGRLVLASLEVLYQYGNKNCLSDLGVSGLLLHTTIVGAVMNMKINLSGISCNDLKGKYQEVIDDLFSFSNNEVLGFVNKVYEKL